MRVNADLPDIVVHDSEDAPIMWMASMTPDVKAALIVLICLAAVVGAAIIFVRVVGF